MSENKEKERLLEDIGSLLGFFNCDLGNPRKVELLQHGDLAAVRRGLIETLSFLSGFSEEEIVDSLEELRV